MKLNKFLVLLSLIALIAVPSVAQSETRISVFTASQPSPLWLGYTGRTGDGTFIFNAIHCSLIELDDQFNIVSDLADSWELSDDETTYTFNLNPNATFHDGTPVTAADVEFSWVIFATPAERTEKRTRASVYEAIVGADAVIESAASEDVTSYADTVKYEGIEIVDDHTIRFTLDSPNPLWLSVISDGSPNGFILPKHLLEDVPYDDYPTHPMNLSEPVGCGPYELTDIQDGQFVELTAYDSHHLGTPNIDQIFVHSWLTNEVAAAQLESGELDLVLGLSLDDAQRLESNENINIVTTNASNAYQLSINLDPRDMDIRVRQAMAHAIDREGILEAAFFGLGEVVECCFFQDWAIPDGQEVRIYNPDLARELLAEAEADGAWSPDTVYSILYPAGYRYSDILMPIIQAQLAEVGIQVELDPRESTAHSEALQAGEWDIWYNQSANMLPDPGSFPRWECFNGTAQNSGWRFCDDRKDELYVDGRSTTDVEERAEIYQEIQQIFYDNVPAVNLVVPPSVFGVRDHLEGFTPTPNLWLSSWNINDWSVTE